MTTIKTNHTPPQVVSYVHQIDGMSLRDWFAGQFLAGCAAAPDMSNDSNVVASAAYNYADAMMEARKK